MKKSRIIAGVTVFAAALAFVVYINTKPSSPKDAGAQQIADADVATDDAKSDNYKSHGFFGDSGSMPAPATAPGAQGSNDPKSVKLDTFVQNARIAEEFKFLDEQMDMQYERLKKMAGPEELATFEELRNQLKGDELMAEYKEILREQFSEAELDQVNEIYQSPEFQRYKAADAEKRTQEGMKKQAEFARTFKPDSVPEDRREALQELVKASGAAEQMKEMLNGVGSMLGGGASKMKGSETKAYQDMIEKSINEAMFMTQAMTFEGKPVEAIRDMTKVVGNPVLQRLEAAKVTYITQKLVKVVEPKIQEAMKK